jgi:hypothetical protein
MATAACQSSVCVNSARWSRLWLAAVLLITALPSGAQDVTDRGPVRSNLDTHGWSAVRDCGFSEPLVTQPGSSLWIFCDSVITRPDRSWYFLTSSAAVGPDTPGTAPQGLVERGPYGVPTQFLPRATGIGCPGGYTPAWASGAILLAFTSRILIPYVSFCVVPPGTMTPRRYGVAEWDTATGTFTHNATAVFRGQGSLAPALQLGSPVYHGGYWYFFSSECRRAAFGACGEGSIFAARVAVGSDAVNERPWANPRSYRWLGPAGWTPAWGEAQSVVTDARPVGLSVDWYPRFNRFVMVEQTSIAGHVRVWTASSPAGPWDLRTSARVPCAASPDDDGSLCRAVIGHPELSTDSALALSFFQPADGRVHVVTLSY